MKFGGIVAPNSGCLSLTLGLCSSFSFSFGFLLVIDEVSWNRRDTCKTPVHMHLKASIWSFRFILVKWICLSVVFECAAAAVAAAVFCQVLRSAGVSYSRGDGGETQRREQHLPAG